MDKHARLLTEPTNYAVVQLPGRQKPGVVFQGDSLHILAARIARIQVSHKNQHYKVVGAELARVKAELVAVLNDYERTCNDRGIGLPYLRDPLLAQS